VREQTQQLHTVDNKSVEEVRNSRPQRSKNDHKQHSHHAYRDNRDKRGSPKGQTNHLETGVQLSGQFAENAIGKVTILQHVSPKQLLPQHMDWKLKTQPEWEQ